MNTRAARTLLIWSFYLFGLGLTLLFVPNALLGVFGMAPTNEVWIRVIGMLVLILGYFSFMSARTGNEAFMRWSAHARSSVILFFIAFVLLGLAEPTLILFGVVDLAAAIWTFSALRKS
jgi:hypothetical protein